MKTTKKLTTEEFIKRARVVHKNKYSYDKTIYVNSQTPVVVTCEVHGDFESIPNNHVHHNSGCPKCCGRIKKTTEQFIEQVKRKHGKGKFTFDKTEYVNDSSKVVITCKRHGDFTPVPSNVLQGSGCSKCSKEKMSVERSAGKKGFVRKAIDIHGNTYDYSLVEYKNNHTKVKILCSKHGIFEQQPNVHTDQKCGCPVCNLSRGEMQVHNWLVEHGIKFIEQHSFDDCVHKKKLKFDFFLPDFGILLEYNGIQHYKNVPMLEFSNDTLETIQERDNIKADYAKRKGLQLLVIPYSMKVELFLNRRLRNAGGCI